ncbi:MAG: ATP-binding protein, partial [bacterium]
GALLLWNPLRIRLLRKNFHLPSLSDYISTVLMLFIGLILFAETTYQGREMYRELKGDIRSGLQEKSRAIQQSLNHILFTSRQGVVKIADFVPKLRNLKDDPARQATETRALALFLREQYPLLNRFYLTDSRGRLLHNLLPRRAGDGTPGSPLLINNQSPKLLWATNDQQFAWASVQYEGRENLQLAIVETLYRPNGKIDCLAVGTVSPKALEQALGILNPLFSDSGIKVTITDPEKWIVFPPTRSHHGKYSLDSGQLEALGDGFSLKFPPGEKPAMVRWGESVMVYSTPLAALGGKLHLEQPLAEYQAVMQEKINHILAELLLLMMSFILITLLISAYFNRQMQRVMTYTDEVQRNVEDGNHLGPQLSSPIREMDNLSGKIRDSALENQRLLSLERVNSVELKEALAKLKQMQTELELQTSQHARIEAYKDFIHTIGNLITPVRVKVARLSEEGNVENYLEQLVERTRLFLEKSEEGELQRYLDGEGNQDLHRFIQGLNHLREIQKGTVEDFQVMEKALNKVVESTTHQSRLQIGLSLQEDVDLVLVVRGVISLLEDNWRAKRIRHEIRLESTSGGPPPDHALLKVEKVRLFNMVHNILKNAGESFQNGTREPFIQVVIKTGSGTSLVITDNGKGMSSEELGLVGEIGYTTKNKNDLGEGGSGLGLHNGKIFMANIGGELDIDSKGHSHGVKVTINFPEQVRA